MAVMCDKSRACPLCPSVHLQQVDIDCRHQLHEGLTIHVSEQPAVPILQAAHSDSPVQAKHVCSCPAWRPILQQQSDSFRMRFYTLRV